MRCPIDASHFVKADFFIRSNFCPACWQACAMSRLTNTVINSRAVRIGLTLAAFAAASFSRSGIAREHGIGLTPAGQAILLSKLALEAARTVNFPVPMCAFPGGLCGAVRRDGTVAVAPRYDWVGTFSEDRAAVRVGGLYGFVDEDGQEVVPPQYRIVADYKFGFAQVDVDGRSGLIDRDGKMVIAPQYGLIDPIAPNRFRISEPRRTGGVIGAEDFSGATFEILDGGGIRMSGPLLLDTSGSGIIDRTGQWIEPLGTREFDRDDPSVRLVLRDKLWGVARTDGSWLIEPKFDQVDALSDGLARARINGKIGCQKLWYTDTDRANTRVYTMSRFAR
jgi:WG containing repeat